MGQLKRDHGGYHSSGLWIKYQQPAVVERNVHKSKKDTNKWCKGKVGKPHDFVQTLHRSKYEAFTWYTCKCNTCGKQVYKKRVKSLPLKIQVEGSSGIRSFPIQVKVNGKAIPIDPRRFTEDFCWQCMEWHTY